jgi:hypothetical protein
MDPSEINVKEWNSFATTDPFNNNFVEGNISRHSGDDYGALLIQKVNGDKVPQLIYCTPKLAYPFDHNGNWHWPKAKRIERYEKLDGTNVFSFRYVDSRGGEYVSFKTRLLPFLGQSKFGPFLQMWKEILKDFPILIRLPLLTGMNISYELWGARNPHLVRYEKPLAASILFARSGRKLIPPSQLTLPDGVSSLVAPFRGLVDKDYVWEYQQAKGVLESNLREVEDGYAGSEGEVWYLQDETGSWILYKCKPETIEMIHWAAGGIGRNVLRATIENAFENWNEPTVDQIRELLLEEFSEVEVDKAQHAIEHHLKEALKYHILVNDVLSAYSDLGMSILDDKATVMRALAPKFRKDQMRKVFNIIWAHTAH